VEEASLAEIVYDAGDWDAQRRTPSDHCPIVVALDWPATD
jgi:exonuclease III